MNNGWISVMEGIKPESGEEVLVLSYAGDFPAPEDLFADPDDRAYSLCTYFYPGDHDWNEVPGDPSTLTPSALKKVTFDEEGFYFQEPLGPRSALTWRRVKTIEDSRLGIVCWKSLDWPHT